MAIREGVGGGSGWDTAARSTRSDLDEETREVARWWIARKNTGAEQDTASDTGGRKTNERFVFGMVWPYG